ncbi:hypothetical protein A2U01_0119085, partial [Trifolium medium]|nr:hypothetical protein [Trifolium medium]
MLCCQARWARESQLAGREKASRNPKIPGSSERKPAPSLQGWLG